MIPYYTSYDPFFERSFGIHNPVFFIEFIDELLKRNPFLSLYAARDPSRYSRLESEYHRSHRRLKGKAPGCLA